jgi:ABC-type glycerol-3-phosphate transport system substrate-binding protein
MSITTTDESKFEAAANFVTMFSGGDEEIMLGILADVGYLPVQQSLAEHEQFKQTEWDETILSELPFAKTRPAVEIYPDASLEWTLAFQEVLSEQKEAQQAVDDAELRTLTIAEEKGYLG